MTNKLLFGFYSVGALMAGFVGGFMGYPVYADGLVDISIVEKVDDGAGGYNDWSDITGAMPGTKYSAIPQVENSGQVPVEVRVCLSESAVCASGETAVLPARAFEIEINDSWSLDNEGEADSTDPAAGNCYKYNSMIEPGEMTEPVFYEVKIGTVVANEHQGATFTLRLDAEAKSSDGDSGDSDSITVITNESTPSNPDTGVASKSEALSTPWTIALSLGLGALLVVVGLYIVKNLKHK